MTYKALTLFMAPLLAVPLFAALCAGPAQAQDAQTKTLMQFAANNAGFDKKVEETGRILYRQQIENCSTVDRAVRQLPTPYGNLRYPPDVPGFPAPVHGLWAEHVKILGCGKLWQVNMLAIGREEKDGPMLMALLPGETKADPGTQRTAERMGATTIRKADSSCADDPLATYTRLLGYKQLDGSVGKKDAKEGWFEEWTYRFCQKTIPIQMAFVPDGRDGYEIKARLTEVGASPPVAKPPVTPVADPAAPKAPEAPKPPSASLLTTEDSVPPAE